MIKFFGYFFISLIIATVLVVIDYFLPGNFLNNFLSNGFLEVFATLVGFNIAAVIFLVGQLLDLELKTDRVGSFSATKKELKHNIYCLLILFCVSVFLLIFFPDFKDPSELSHAKLIFYYIDKCLIISIFILSFFNIFEVLKAIFSINSEKNKN